jgi:DNA-binding SARP family transcriptional activator
MYRLPPHHVARPRLVDACAGYQVVVVEAAGGYGKSVLGAELVDSWCAVGIEVQLEHGGVTAALLAARLNAAVLRAGFTDAASATEASHDAVSTVDTLLGALAAERCAFVIDDAHNAAPDAGELIAYLAVHLQGAQRLVVLARNLPRRAGRLRRAEFFQLGATDLALNLDETLALCRSGFGLETSAAAATALDEATGGWTAATVLAAARAARTGETVETVAEAATGPAHPAGAVAAVLESALQTLGPALWPLLSQVARLPLLDADLVHKATGDEALFEEALRAGIPFAPAHGPWWDLPGPVRDHLSTYGPLDLASVRRAADEYRWRGELRAALELLLASGQAAEAAGLLATTTPEAAEALDALEVRALFEQLPGEAVDTHPGVLVVVARQLGPADQMDRCRALLERARHIAVMGGDGELERSASAELLRVLSADLDHGLMEKSARYILAQAAAGEALTRGRAHFFLGVALCWRLDGEGRRDDGALAEAEECFARATDIYRTLGMRSAVATVAPYWAVYIEFARGHVAAAMARIEEALDLTPDRPRRWAHSLIWRAWFAADLGQYELCRATVAEIFRVAEQLDSDTLRAQGHWKLAISASYSGDAEETMHHVRQVEERKGPWWSSGSGDFLSEAADLLDRVGHISLAREYLARVKAEPKDAAHLVALAEAALEARHGDPGRAEELLQGLSHQRIDPREYWRITLLRSYAALRRGEDGTAGVLAAQAFEGAARLGQHQLPLIRERAVTEQLLGLAVNTGQPAAIALKATSLPMSLSVLGRFELTSAGRPVAVGFGQEAQLLKFIAAYGGRVEAEQATKALWPEVGPVARNNRLRTVLNRLRRSVGDALAREGEMLVVGGEVRLDLNDFYAQAARAQALAPTDLPMAAAIAKGAMAIYRGEVLPEDRYEDWAETARQKAQATMLDLLDLCAREAVRRGDLDGLRRTVERTVELAPYDDFRYLSGASALLQQGRRGEALAVVQRARSAFAELGLDPPRPLLDLERSIVA